MTAPRPSTLKAACDCIGDGIKTLPVFESIKNPNAVRQQRAHATPPLEYNFTAGRTHLTGVIPATLTHHSMI